MIHKITIYKLSYASGNTPEQIRYFTTTDYASFVKSFVDLVKEFSDDETVSGAYVTGSRLPDRIYTNGMSLMAWTKMDAKYKYTEGHKNLSEVK